MTKLQHLKPFLFKTSRQFHHGHRHLSRIPNDENNKNEHLSSMEKKKTNRPMHVLEEPTCIEDVVEPTNCCMSGCPNCVWIEYAEKLSSFLKDNPADIQKMIMEKVQDPNMKAFLSMELRVRKIIE